MLDDRLTSAGLALREATVPDAGLDSLAARRRRRGARRAGAAAVALVLLAGAGVAARDRRHDPVRVVDQGSLEVRVPTPTGPPQLLPVPLPEGYRLASWGEATGGQVDHPPQLQLFGTGSGATFATEPYVAVLEVPTSTLRAGDAADAEIVELPYGLRSLGFSLGDRNATVAGWQLADDELRAVAEGVHLVDDKIVVGQLPTGFARILQSTDAFSAGPWSRTFTLRKEVPAGRAGANDSTVRAVTITTDDSTFEHLEQIAWRYPGTTVIRREGHEILRLESGDRVTWTWLDGDRYVRLESASDDEDVLADITATMRPVSTGDLTKLVEHVPADAEGAASIYALSPHVPYLDDTVLGVRLRRMASLAHTPEGVQACIQPGGCHPIPDTERPLVPWLPLDQHVASFAVRDDVSAVAVRYAGRATRVMAPVRVVRGAARVVGVIQLDDLPVTSIEARASDGRVLQVIEGPLPPWKD